MEKFLAADKKNRDLNKNYSTNAWDVTWINDTSARLDYTYKGTNGTWIKTTNDVVIYTVFPTTQDATNYLNAMDKTAYNLNSTQYSGGTYQTVTDNAPQIYKVYKWSERDGLWHSITQEDYLIIIETGTLTTTYG